MARSILVLGATSKAGAEVVSLLRSKGEEVKAAGRDISKLERASEQGAKPVRFDYDDEATWREALLDVDRVFVLARPADVLADTVINPFFDRAREAGVAQIVFMTAMGVEQNEDIPLRKAERYLEGLGLNHTFIRPNWFNQNFNLGYLKESITKMGGIYVPAEEAKISFVDARDIAAVAVAALTEDGHGGKKYTLTGSEALSHGEVATILSDATGREIRYQSVSEGDARGAMLDGGWKKQQVDYMMMLFSVVRQGFSAAISGDVKTVLGREPIPFKQFANDFADDWKE